MSPAVMPMGPTLPVSPPPQVAQSRQVLLKAVVATMLGGNAVVTIAGEQGVGKTTMLQVVTAELQCAGLLVVQVNGARCSRDELHRRMSAALSMPPEDARDARDLLRALLNHYRRTEIAVLIDDADKLTVGMFRYLRVLLDLFNCLETNLYVVLAGVTGTWDGLRQLDIETFEKIAPDPVVITALTQDEARAYLRQALRPQRDRPPRYAMTTWQRRSLLRKAGGNPAAINAALSARRKQIGPGKAGLTTLGVPVAAWVGGATYLILVGAVAVAPQRPPSPAARDTYRMLAAPTPSQGVGVGLVDTFSAAVAMAMNDPSANEPAQDGAVPVPVPRSAPAEQPSRPAPQRDTETLPKLSVPQSPAVADVPGAAAPAPALSPDPILDPPDRLSTAPLVEASPMPPDSVPLRVTPQEGPAAASNPAMMSTPFDQAASAALPAKPGQVATSTGPGLVLIARRGDTLDALYAKVYHGSTFPPFSVVLRANPKPLVPGTIVVFPAPTEGWARQ